MALGVRWWEALSAPMRHFTSHTGRHFTALPGMIKIQWDYVFNMAAVKPVPWGSQTLGFQDLRLLRP